MTTKSLAYLDFLGFSNIVENEDFSYANEFLQTPNIIIGIAMWEQKHKESKAYAEECLQKIAKKNQVDSFEDFLALSDSIFIVSSEANIFIEQLSSFLYRCFIYNKFYYPSKKLRHPKQKHYPPVFFRGGISFGEVNFSEMIAIENGKNQKRTRNIIGKAVIQAVQLEKQGKSLGARISIEQGFYEKLDDEHKNFVYTDAHGKYLLWPAFIINQNSCINAERNSAKDFLDELFKMYKYYENKGKMYEKVVVNYLETIKMALNSFKQAFITWYGQDLRIEILNFVKKSGIPICDLS